MKQQMDEKKLQTVEESLEGIEKELGTIGCFLGVLLGIAVLAVTIALLYPLL